MLKREFEAVIAWSMRPSWPQTCVLEPRGTSAFRAVEAVPRVTKLDSTCLGSETDTATENRLDSTSTDPVDPNIDITVMEFHVPITRFPR